MTNPISEGRRQTLRAFTRAPLDVLVIGGGIVGAGIARDAAMRGLRVGLVEQHDFAFGTSSRSSRLLHGGLRYLAQGRIGLVREASVEKTVLHHIAPHLASPLPFLFPTYRGDKDWRLWQLKIGVKVYDLLCGGRNFGRSTWLDAAAVRRIVPSLAGDGLQGAVRYYDGFTNDARLTLDTLRSAANAGALVLNYCRFKDAQRLGPSSGAGGRVTPCAPASDDTQHGPHAVTRSNLWECEVEDRLLQTALSVRAQAVVNATGPWADGLPHSRVKLRVTKGVHLVVEHTRLPVPETVVMTEGKRILFAIPWGERTILGTTDTDYNGTPDDVRADAADLRYVLQITNRFFPDAKLTERDILSTWAGLRPLIADPNGQPSDISRAHEITNPEPGWWDVAGGKLTTYRLMAEQTVDRIVESFKPLKREIAACRTAEEPLLAEDAVAGVSGIRPPEFSRRVVEHGCANEWAVHLDDVMTRRTGWHYYHRDAAHRARQAADWMAAVCGWDEAQRAAEVRRYELAVGATSTASASPGRLPPSVATR